MAPLLDVSDIIADPDFSDNITVIRSNRSVDLTGRTVDSPGTYFSYGCVQPSSGTDLLIIPEAERIGSFITVVTPMRLFALTPTTAPDRVIWNNNTYQVKQVKDWSSYGKGFVEAICELLAMTTTP